MSRELECIKRVPFDDVAGTDTFGVSLDVGSAVVLNELKNSATTEQDKIVLNDTLVQLLEGVICERHSCTLAQLYYQLNCSPNIISTSTQYVC